MNNTIEKILNNMTSDEIMNMINLLNVYKDNRLKNTSQLEVNKNGYYINKNVYKFLDKNDITLKYIKNHLNSLYVVNEMNIKMFIPRIMLGRRQGHTYTLSEYIKNNNDINFLLFSNTKYNIEKELYHNVKNVFYYLDNIRGIKINYIVFDGGVFDLKHYNDSLRRKKGCNIFEYLLSFDRYEHDVYIAGIGS